MFDKYVDVFVNVDNLFEQDFVNILVCCLCVKVLIEFGCDEEVEEEFDCIKCFELEVDVEDMMEIEFVFVVLQWYWLIWFEVLCFFVFGEICLIWWVLQDGKGRDI